MVTIPLFLLLLLITAMMLKAKSAKAGSVILGLLLGLSLASTTFGRDMLGAFTDMTNGIVHAVDGNERT